MSLCDFVAHSLSLAVSAHLFWKNSHLQHDIRVFGFRGTGPSKSFDHEGRPEVIRVMEAKV